MSTKLPFTLVTLKKLAANSALAVCLRLATYSGYFSVQGQVSTSFDFPDRAGLIRGTSWTLLTSRLLPDTVWNWRWGWRESGVGAQRAVPTRLHV